MKNRRIDRRSEKKTEKAAFENNRQNENKATDMCRAP